MNGQNRPARHASRLAGVAGRDDIKIGAEVEVVLKPDQASGVLTRGIVAEILTNSPTHPYGIKVRLESGQVGRVQSIISKI
jgi:uncharacterized repeat protein (TIGR03833 family)